MTSVEPIQTSTRRRHRFEVVVQPSMLLDAVLVLWTALGADEKVDAHELGKRWFDDVRRRIPSDLVEELVAFGGDHGKVWMTLIGWIGSAPDPSDTAATLDWLESSPDAAERRRMVLADMCWQADATDLDGAVAGDRDAVSRCLSKLDGAERDAAERWLSVPPDVFAGAAARALRRFVAEVLPDDTAAWPDVHACSADAVRPLVELMEPSDLIERVTNGIAYTIPLGVRRLVLVPSVSLRPWTLTHELDDVIYIFYPVADEHVSADADAPPQWLVRFHKALGDERRMRMLRRLAEGPAGLGELTETVGLAKSTVFHHVGILRAAGLLRVHVATGQEAGPSYSLRREALTTAAEFTDRYLGGEQRGDS